MKRYGAILGGAVILSTIAFSVGAWGVNQTPGFDAGGAIIMPEMKSLGPMIAAKARPARDGDIAAAAEEITWWCFFPQDGPTTATVVVLWNTNDRAVQVPFTVLGSEGQKDVPLTLPANAFMQICSDRISPAAGWNWIDFGTGAAIGLLGLPPGVFMDGYIVWNGASDTYDPGLGMHRMPLRFW